MIENPWLSDGELESRKITLSPMLREHRDDLVAIEFRTHAANQDSRAAILRIGATQDGVLRQHMIIPDGSLRDTHVYSILNFEWPGVKEGLKTKLRRKY